jgi:hypothetical protein
MRVRRWLRWVTAGTAVALLGACGAGGGTARATLVVTPTAFSVEPGGTCSLVPTITNIAQPTYEVTLVPPAALQSAGPTALAQALGTVAAPTATTAGSFTAAANAAAGQHGQVVVKEKTSGLSVTIPFVTVVFVQSMTILPEQVSLLVGQETSFTVAPQDVDGVDITDYLVDWRVTGGIGTIDRQGTFTATTAGTGKVVARVGGYQPVEATVTVVAPSAGLLIRPFGNPVLVEVSTTRAFQAVVRDEAGRENLVAATWRVDAAVGSVTDAGLFTAGATVGASGTLSTTARGQTVTTRIQLVALLAPPSGPGNVSGVLRKADGSPAAGGVVEALVDGTTVSGDRTLVGGDGRFRLFLPAGAWRLRGLLDTRTVTSEAFTLETPDERRTIDLTLPN